MKLIMIGHDDIDENELVKCFKNILDQRYKSGSLKQYEIRIITEVKRSRDKL